MLHNKLLALRETYEKAILLGFLSVLSPNLVAQETTLEVICSYSHTIDDKSGISNTSGKDHFLIKYKEDGSARIKKDDLGAWFYGNITDSNITGETSYKLGEAIIEQALDINRNTGEMHITLGIAGKKSGLVHFGKCKKHMRKLF